MTKVQVVPLFAVPLGVSYVDLGDWNPNWSWDKGGKFYSGHRQHTGLETHEDFQKLKTQLELAAREYCKFLGDECPTLTITQMWANCYDRGARIHQHPHPNSLISGVLYLDNHSSTTFVNPVIPQLKLNYSEADSNSYNAEHFTAAGERGRVLLFPSWLNHLGEPSEAEQRITISFNTFPKELGNSNRLDHWKVD
jgi:uncharacterized protein (TIGR02466 family)